MANLEADWYPFALEFIVQLHFFEPLLILLRILLAYLGLELQINIISIVLEIKVSSAKRAHLCTEIHKPSVDLPLSRDFVKTNSTESMATLQFDRLNHDFHANTTTSLVLIELLGL